MNFSIDVPQADIALQVAAEAAAADHLARELPPELSHTLVRIMKWRDCTVDELAEGALLSTKTIQRIRNGDVTEPKIETSSAIVVYLQLPDPLLDAFMQRTGKVYTPTVEHQIMRSLVYRAYGRFTVNDVNEALRAQGMEELTGKE